MNVEAQYFFHGSDVWTLAIPPLAEIRHTMLPRCLWMRVHVDELLLKGNTD